LRGPVEANKNSMAGIDACNKTKETLRNPRRNLATQKPVSWHHSSEATIYLSPYIIVPSPLLRSPPVFLLSPSRGHSIVYGVVKALQ
jgi:hypothetical protein